MNPLVCFSERHNEPPPFQGYRTQNGPPQSDMEQPYYSEQGVNGFAAPMNSYHGGMGVHQEEPLFNPRGPGRGGETRDPNKQNVKNIPYLPADRPHPRIGHTPNFQWFSWEKKIVRSSTRINKPKFEINNS